MAKKMKDTRWYLAEGNSSTKGLTGENYLRENTDLLTAHMKHESQRGQTDLIEEAARVVSESMMALAFAIAEMRLENGVTEKYDYYRSSTLPFQYLSKTREPAAALSDKRSRASLHGRAGNV
jgi:hypothetical protein